MTAVPVPDHRGLPPRAQPADTHTWPHSLTTSCLLLQDLLSILPMLEDTCVLRLSGRCLVQALETGLSAFPKLEGRFLQASHHAGGVGCH